MLTVGLDIGGANLKAATNDGDAVDRPFPLWKHPERLSSELRSLVAAFPQFDLVAVTMTGELADCFSSKAEGVRSIIHAVESATDRPVRFWSTSGEFLDAVSAASVPRLVAASNWHALATFCGRIVPEGDAVLIDIGSTTTDIIRLRNGTVCSEGMTDLERLTAGELVYTGVGRTPLCAFGLNVLVDGEPLPLAAELFATTLDVHLLLGHLPEDVTDSNTADGRPAIRTNALSRLARMLCADPDEVGDDRLLRLAEAIAVRQRRLISEAIQRVISRCEKHPVMLLSGSGAFLVTQILEEQPTLESLQTIRLDELFERRVSRSACAFAVARLAAEQVGRCW
jgi:(4-(4-[2-(gamma-L-glutamylamino)ethyl]phenoxymethyl)furan-2-yl)methanamine synthase